MTALRFPMHRESCGLNAPVESECTCGGEARPWRWRNLRSLSVGIEFTLFPWDWKLKWDPVDADGMGGCTGMTWVLVIGPVAFALRVGSGNCSAPGLQGRVGLSEEEAWERSK